MTWFWKKETKKTERERVAERREEVLARGRKFKYPLQWTRYRVVVNTIMIAFLALSVVAVAGWAALYRFNVTDSLMFNVTKVLPLSVAEVDGEKVRFSDYLMLYRSSMASVEKQSGGQLSDLETMRRNYQRMSLTEAEKYTYALKLAKAAGIEVTDAEVEAAFQQHLQTGGTRRSEESFLKIVLDNFGLTKREYSRLLYLTLLRARVEEKTDEGANAIATEVEQKLTETGGDFAKVAEEMGDKVEYEDTGGLVDSTNIDGGRAARAMELEPGQSSSRFVSLNGDGIYFVKLIEKTEVKVNFVSIRVPFSELEAEFAELQEQGKVQEEITLQQE